jgi:hypothetical protein
MTIKNFRDTEFRKKPIAIISMGERGDIVTDGREGYVRPSGGVPAGMWATVPRTGWEGRGDDDMAEIGQPAPVGEGQAILAKAVIGMARCPDVSLKAPAMVRGAYLTLSGMFLRLHTSNGTVVATDKLDAPITGGLTLQTQVADLRRVAEAAGLGLWNVWVGHDSGVAALGASTPDGGGLVFLTMGAPMPRDASAPPDDDRNGGGPDPVKPAARPPAKAVEKAKAPADEEAAAKAEVSALDALEATVKESMAALAKVNLVIREVRKEQAAIEAQRRKLKALARELAAD